MRGTMMKGAVSGKSEAATAQTESGSFISTGKIPKAIQTGTAASGVNICRSCEVSQVAARPVKSAL